MNPAPYCQRLLDASRVGREIEVRVIRHGDLALARVTPVESR